MRVVKLPFPIGGYNARTSYAGKPPHFTSNCLNVAVLDPLEERVRGGKRAGLIKTFTSRDSDNPVRMLAQVTEADLATSGSWRESFILKGNSLGYPKFYVPGTGPTLSGAAGLASTAFFVYQSGFASPAQSGDDYVFFGGCNLEAEGMDVTKPYTVRMGCFVEDEGFADFIIAALIEPTAFDATDVVWGRLRLNVNATYSWWLMRGTGTQIATGSGTGTGAFGELSLAVGTGTSPTLVLKWQGTTLSSTTHPATVVRATNSDVGFGMWWNSTDGSDFSNNVKVDYFHVDFGRDTTDDLNRTTKIVLAENGKVFRESDLGELTHVDNNPGGGGTTLTVSSTNQIQAAEFFGQLFIADYGVSGTGTNGVTSGTQFTDAGIADFTALGATAADYLLWITASPTGTPAINSTHAINSIASGAITLANDPGAGTSLSWKLIRAPKVFDTQTIGTTTELQLLEATEGNAPFNCPLVCEWDTRLVWAGGDPYPHAMYMSRQGDPYDYDTSQDDFQAAFGGTTDGDRAVVAQPIKAIAPYFADYLFIACARQLFVMRGNPRAGGILERVSNEVGMVGPKAFCFTPEGTLIFATHAGLYELPRDSREPIPLSQEVIPRELRQFNESDTVLLAYDGINRRAHVFVTPAAGTKRQWAIQWPQKSFWPFSYASAHHPTAILDQCGGVAAPGSMILGCRDGYLRHHSIAAQTDDGTAISNYIVIGPARLGDGSDLTDGYVEELTAMMDPNSDDATWGLAVGDSHAEIIDTDTYTDATGTWTAGTNYVDRPRMRGRAFAVKMTGGSSPNANWAMESLTALATGAGMARKL